MQTTTTGENFNTTNYNLTIPPTKDSIIERLLYNRQITLQEALILLKEIHNHYPLQQPSNLPYNPLPYTPPYWPTILY
jgi:hypothetical protein